MNQHFAGWNLCGQLAEIFHRLTSASIERGTDRGCSGQFDQPPDLRQVISVPIPKRREIGYHIGE